VIVSCSFCFCDDDRDLDIEVIANSTAQAIEVADELVGMLGPYQSDCIGKPKDTP
jgi:hypothetical protein